MTPEEVAARSVAAMWAEDHASRGLGMEIVEVGPGRATVTMVVREDMVNGHQVCHGGFIASLADSAFAFACNTHGDVTFAAGFEVDLLEPARVGDVLTAEAVERVRRSRSGVYDVTVWRDGTVIALFRGRSRSLGRPIADDG